MVYPDAISAQLLHGTVFPQKMGIAVKVAPPSGGFYCVTRYPLPVTRYPRSIRHSKTLRERCLQAVVTLALAGYIFNRLHFVTRYPLRAPHPPW